MSLTILVASQSVLVLPACQGAIDPRIPPWLVEAQRRASATGGVLARAGVLIAALLAVIHLGTSVLYWAAFALSLVSVVAVLLRLPRELRSKGLRGRVRRGSVTGSRDSDFRPMVCQDKCRMVGVWPRGATRRPVVVDT